MTSASDSSRRTAPLDITTTAASCARAARDRRVDAVPLDQVRRTVSLGRVAQHHDTDGSVLGRARRPGCEHVEQLRERDDDTTREQHASHPFPHAPSLAVQRAARRRTAAANASGCFLRDVVADVGKVHEVVNTREVVPIFAGVGAEHAVRATFEHDRRNGDVGHGRDAFFGFVIARIAGDEAEAVPVGVPRRRPRSPGCRRPGALRSKSALGERPRGLHSQLPQQPAERHGGGCRAAGPTVLAVEVVLVRRVCASRPPGAGGPAVVGDVLDVVAAAGHQAPHPLRPEGGDDAGGPHRPVVAGEHGLVDRPGRPGGRARSPVQGRRRPDRIAALGRRPLPPQPRRCSTTTRQPAPARTGATSW